MRRLPLLGVAAVCSISLLQAAYTYFVSDTFATTTIDTTTWSVNGTPTGGANGFQNPNAASASAIAKSGAAVPAGEVLARLKLTASTGNYQVFLQATSDAVHGPSTSGSYIVHELQNVTLTTTGCTAALRSYVRNTSGTIALIAETLTLPCRDGMELHAVNRNGFTWVYVDGFMYNNAPVSSYALPMAGKGGVGGNSMPAGNGISQAALGQIDTIAPPALDPNLVGTAVFSNKIELLWNRNVDDVHGIGVLGYILTKSGVSGAVNLAQPSFVDQNVAPSTAYTYTLTTVDWHGNSSAPATINVTTPATGNVDLRQTGLRPTGTYWGGMGEQIDLRSGNLNYTLPLLKAVGRGGWGVTFALNYNSQNWLQNNNRSWNLGKDTGTGFGWRFLAGSMVPVYSDYMTIAFYKFSDSTGAEYRFDQVSGGVWRTKEGLFAEWVPAEKKLYFPDGSWWFFGTQAGGTEQDSGFWYPSLMQDTNGNQVKVRYAAAAGTGLADSSGRVKEIEDVRAAGYGPPNNYATYFCSYNTDVVPRLTGCNSTIANESWTLGYGSFLNIVDPFYLGGANGQNVPNSKQLHWVQNATGAKTQFNYSGANTGELTTITFPQGGTFEYNYNLFSFSGGRAIRKVASRVLNAQDGQGPKTYTFDMTPDTNGSMPSETRVTDASGTADKRYFFNTASGSAIQGTLSVLYERALPAYAIVRSMTPTWSLTSNGNAYISATVEGLDLNSAGAKQQRTEQLIDDKGNLQWRKQYGYMPVGGGAGSLLRTYNYNYLTTSHYTNRRIYNRVTSVTMTPAGGAATTLVTNTYDAYAQGIQAVTGARQHDGTGFGIGTTHRGNVTSSTSPGQIRNMNYDMLGNVLNGNDGYGHSASKTMDAAKNFAVPSTMTAGSLPSSTMSYNSAIQVTSTSGPNGASSSFSYDTYARPSQTTAANGQVTTYTYDASTFPKWTIARTGTRWVKTEVDGLGRTLKSSNGYRLNNTDTTVAIVENEYTPCACTPIGKVKRTTLPYAPGGTKYWTENVYDALGRTLQVKQPNNRGTTTYLYLANVVKVTDPAGKWKQYEQDALGNLVKVVEPNPLNGVSGQQAVTELVTNYSYNTFNQLVTVSMPRPNLGTASVSSTQTRTFNYNATTLRLDSVTHPEHGQISYVYNNDGTLLRKTDAKGQQIEYTYDANARVSTVVRKQVGGAVEPCTTVTYGYDSNAIDASFSQNLSGRLATISTGAGCVSTQGEIVEMFSYNSWGGVTKKRLRVKRQPGATPVSVDKDIEYTFDAEGRLSTTKYPDYYHPFTTTYDNLGRPEKMTGPVFDQNTSAWTTMDHVNGVTYNVAGAMTAMSYLKTDLIQPFSGNRYFVESRAYDELNQLTRQTTVVNGAGPTVADVGYGFSTTANNGRITSRTNYVSGESVAYQYDALNCLLSATATGGSSPYTMTFLFDGFGNRWDQRTTSGTGPTTLLSYNYSNNRLSTAGYGYDSNGNMTSMPGASGIAFDVDNRLRTVNTNGSAEEYAYLADNKRVYKKETIGGVTKEFYYLYGVGGQRLTTYRVFPETNGQGQPTFALYSQGIDVHFAGRMIRANGKAVVHDRLGSVVARHQDSASNQTLTDKAEYFPYGEERGTAAPQGQDKFGTYHRDQTGLDYADQRYYASGNGIFLTHDPYGGSADPLFPNTWNRYSYVLSDPINGNDPNGLLTIIIGGMAGAAGAFGVSGPTASNPAWAQSNTSFNNQVSAFYGESAIPYVWSGSADQSSIEREAQKLAAFIFWRMLGNPNQPLNIVAHSHGGNLAAAMTQREDSPVITSLITMGTPWSSTRTDVNPNNIKTFLNVYSSKDRLQPFGAFGRNQVFTFGSIAAGIVSSFLGIPGGSFIWGAIIGANVPISSRTNKCAINIGISNVFGFGDVGHEDYYKPQVWNAVTSWLSRAGYGTNPSNATVGYCAAGESGGLTVPGGTRDLMIEN